MSAFPLQCPECGNGDYGSFHAWSDAAGGLSWTCGKCKAGSLSTPPLEPYVLWEPPKHHCRTHGDHSFWISMKPNADPKSDFVHYCQFCIMDFMDRQSIGKAV